MSRGRTHTWSFGAGIDDVVYTMPKIASDDPTAEPALANGYKQKIADAGALARDQKTGAAPTPDKRAEAMRTVATRLADEKQWNATAGAKPKLIDVDALIAAILAVKSKPEAGVRAYVESRTEDQRKNLANSKDFAEAYAIAVAKRAPCGNCPPNCSPNWTRFPTQRNSENVNGAPKLAPYLHWRIAGQADQQGQAHRHLATTFDTRLDSSLLVQAGLGRYRGLTVQAWLGAVLADPIVVPICSSIVVPIEEPTLAFLAEPHILV